MKRQSAWRLTARYAVLKGKVPNCLNYKTLPEEELTNIKWNNHSFPSLLSWVVIEDSSFTPFRFLCALWRWQVSADSQDINIIKQRSRFRTAFSSPSFFVHRHLDRNGLPLHWVWKLETDCYSWTKHKVYYTRFLFVNGKLGWYGYWSYYICLCKLERLHFFIKTSFKKERRGCNEPKVEDNAKNIPQAESRLRTFLFC